MLDLSRLLPLRFFAPSLGAGILYFLMQVGWLSWYAYSQCPTANESGIQGCIWYVYKQVPSALPLAAVFSAGLMVVLQVSDRFWESFPDGESKWGVKHRLRGILLLCSIAIVVLGLTFYADEIPMPLTLFFAVVLYILISQPWFDWVKQLVSRDRNNEGE